MFVWAPLPEGYTNSADFCMELMEKSGVICVPGSSFGTLGEGYVLSLIHILSGEGEQSDSTAFPRRSDDDAGKPARHTLPCVHGPFGFS